MVQWMLQPDCKYAINLQLSSIQFFFADNAPGHLPILCQYRDLLFCTGNIVNNLNKKGNLRLCKQTTSKLKNVM